MTGRQKNVKFASILLAGVAMSASATAWAQEEASDDGLQAIIVTAQKRAQNLQDVGVAVTALSNDALDIVGKRDVVALTNAVPSLQVTTYSPALTVFNLRGVSQNDFSDFQEAPIAFYNDEVYIGALGAIAGQTFDLERVEVLRGPQGTLFGRNATGGLIQAVTAKPTKDFQAYFTGTYGSYNQFATEGAVSGPITDHIRGRFAITSNSHDGFYTNQYPGAQDGGNSRFLGARAQLEFDVGATGTLRLKAEYLRNDNEVGGANSGIAATTDENGLGVAIPNRTIPVDGGYQLPSDPFTNNTNFPGLFDRTYWNLTARYEQDLGFATLTSITNYQSLKKKYAEDTDATPYDLLQVSSFQDLSQLSQELRLANDGDRLKWVVGAYGLKVKSQGGATAFVDPVYAELFNEGGPLPIGTFATDNAYSNVQKTDSLAFFAQGEYRLTDQFSFILGGRYSWDWKKYQFNQAVGFPGFFTPQFDNYSFSGDRTFKNWSGKAEIDFRPNDDTLLYISVNRGTKGGGFNAPNVVPDPLTFEGTPEEFAAARAEFDTRMSFGQEVLTNYEGGFKLTLLDRKVTFNGALFHYDYKGYQAFQNLSGSSFIVNKPAKITGVEFEMAARPIPQLNLSAFVTHLFEAKVSDIALPGPLGDGNGEVVSRRMPQTPEWSIGGTASFTQSIGEAGDLTLATNWKYNSDQNLTVFNSSVDKQEGYVVGNVRVSFQPPSQKWEAAFFVNNVTDKVYKVFVSDNSFTSVAEAIYGRPRWFGGSLTVRFGK